MEPETPPENGQPKEIMRAPLLMRKKGPSDYLRDNLDHVVEMAERAYRHKQSNPEERIPDHPIRAYGYELVHTSSRARSDDGVYRHTITCKVRPMAYAFANQDDGGVNSEACQQIARDLRFGIFKVSPLNLFFKPQHTREDAEAMLAHLLSHGHSQPANASDYAISLEVSLYTRLGTRPSFVCELPFAEGS